MLDEMIRQYENALLRDALLVHEGNRKAAARELGISYRSMRYRVQIHNLEQYAKDLAQIKKERQTNENLVG